MHKQGGSVYQIIYRVITRRHHVLKNGKEIGRFKHTDHALLRILQEFTGYKGDELPFIFKSKMKEIERQTGLKFKGLPKDEF